MRSKKKWRQPKIHRPDWFETLLVVSTFGAAIVYGIYDFLY